MKVIKFGGSSVKDAQAMRNCLNVIENFSEDNLLVILSATYQTTNDLEITANLAKSGEFNKAKKMLDENFKKHIDIAKELSLAKICYSFLDSHYERALSCLEEISKGKGHFELLLDEIYCVGELYSSTLFYHLIKKKTKGDCLWVDARELITTDSNFNNANVLLEKVNNNVKRLKKSHALRNKILVSQGFIGANELSQSTTLGREGSDYSATILANAFGASEVHIMTDVEGIAFCDPRVLSDAHFFTQMSYDFATLMAENGAKVLFPKTLAPLKEKRIPLRVASTKNPHLPGTWIRNECTDTPKLALAIKDNENEAELHLLGKWHQLKGIDSKVIKEGHSVVAVEREKLKEMCAKILRDGLAGDD